MYAIAYRWYRKPDIPKICVVPRHHAGADFGTMTEPATDSFFRNLGPTLVLLRELRGKGQRELARAAGISPSQLSRYEKGKGLPQLNVIERNVRSLDLTPIDLFYTMALVDLREEEMAVGKLPIGEPNLLLTGKLLGRPVSDALRQVLDGLFALQAQFVGLSLERRLILESSILEGEERI